jgi:6-phosphogluconolactonase (cycloisomerase 2 family)
MKAKLLLAAICAVLMMGSVGCSGPSGCATASPGAGSGTSGGAGGSTQSTGACSVGGGTPVAAGTPATFAYYWNQSNIAATEVDTSGNFGQIPNFASPTGSMSAVGGMVIVQKKWLYVAVGLQILGYSINNGTGALTALSGSPFALSGTEVASISTDSGGKFLFVCGANDHQVQAFSIDQTSGAITGVGAFATSDFAAQATTDGLNKYLYVTAGNLGGTVDIYSIGSTGFLTPIGASPMFISIATLRSEPTGKFLFGVTGNGANNGVGTDNHVYVYSIDQSSGVLIPVNGSPFVTTYIPADLAVHPNGSFVYTFNGTITGTSPMEGFQVDTTSGALTALTSSPFTGISATTGLFDQNGGYLFLHAPSTQTMTLVSVDTSGGALKAVGLPITGVRTTEAWAVTDAH